MNDDEQKLQSFLN